MFLPYPLSLISDPPSIFKINKIMDNDLSIISKSDISSISPIPLIHEEQSNNESITKIINDESKRKAQAKKPIFKIESLNKKRGRPSTKEFKIKVHCSSDFDNILSKIQTHFLNFSISLANDCLSSFHLNKKFSFNKFERKMKSKITSKYFNELKNYSIKDLLNNIGISNKYRRYDQNNNKINVKELSKYDWFKNFFEINYLDLFSYYYNDEQPLEELLICDKIIVLSEKTKSFYWLLKKNENLKEIIIQITKMSYFNNKDTMVSA